MKATIWNNIKWNIIFRNTTGPIRTLCDCVSTKSVLLHTARTIFTYSLYLTQFQTPAPHYMINNNRLLVSPHVNSHMRHRWHNRTSSVLLFRFSWHSRMYASSLYFIKRINSNIFSQSYLIYGVISTPQRRSSLIYEAYMIEATWNNIKRNIIIRNTTGPIRTLCVCVSTNSV